MTYKNLGQIESALTTIEDVYTVPSGKSAVVSSIVLCNTTNDVAYVRVSHAIAGATSNDKQFLYYDIPLPSNNTFIATIGVTMASDDTLRLYSSVAGVAMNVYGNEI